MIFAIPLPADIVSLRLFHLLSVLPPQNPSSPLTTHIKLLFVLANPMLNVLNALIHIRLLLAGDEHIRSAHELLLAIPPHPINIHAAVEVITVVIHERFRGQEPSVVFLRSAVHGQLEDIHPHLLRDEILASDVVVVFSRVEVDGEVGAGEDRSVRSMILGFGGGVGRGQAESVEKPAQ